MMAARAASAWRLFDTAPKDGVPILCFHPDDVFAPITGVDLVWWEPSKKIWTMDGDNPVPFAAEMTHWMPIPAPPAGPEL